MNRQERRAAKRARRLSPASAELKEIVISDRGTPYTVRTRDGRLFFDASAIFPIFIEGGPGTLELVGTGFYITRFGHFLTACHVLMDIHEREKTGFMFHRAGSFYPLARARNRCFPMCRTALALRSNGRKRHAIRSRRGGPSFMATAALRGQLYAGCRCISRLCASRNSAAVQKTAGSAGRDDRRMA
jgi:hypothetical protein